MDIKKVLQNILPYGYISSRYNFERKIEDVLNNFSDDKVVNLQEPTKSRYKSIVSVQGFGYSGSGAVVDLLREYTSCQVVGYVSIEGSKTARNISMAEVDFIRLAGGLFEIEKYIDSNNLFHDDALIHRTLCLFHNSCLYHIQELQPIFISFLKSIIDFSLYDLNHAYYNAYLKPPRTRASIYFIKKMPISEYRSICRNFLNTIFNFFYTNGSELFVADQLFSDFEYSMERNLEYVPNLKCIFVPRDPRDLYAWTNYKRIEWIPQELHSFIKWYKIIYGRLYTEKKQSLIVRYESMCLDYENEYNRIVEFLELNEAQHEKKRQCFNPDESRKYVNIWKKSNKPQYDFDTIKEELRDYCCPLVD